MCLNMFVIFTKFSHLTFFLCSRVSVGAYIKHWLVDNFKYLENKKLLDGMYEVVVSKDCQKYWNASNFEFRLYQFSSKF